MRVLIVEDEKKVAAAVRRGLEAEGFAVDVALTGTDGLWMATENRYDVIVLDIMLPGMNGYKVCEQLRDAGNWTPILMLTAKDGEYDQAEALDTGADDYLTKPFSFVVLLARIRALLRRTGRSRPVDLRRPATSRSNPVTHRCSRGDVEMRADRARVRGARVPDAPRRRGRVASRRSSTTCGTSRSRVIRTSSRSTSAICGSKLDEPFGRQLIQTIRGVGYRLDPDGG